MVASTWASSKRGSRIISDALITPTIITEFSANTWNSGNTPSTRSVPCGRRPRSSQLCMALQVMLACVSSAAFGTPVVPPVYCSTAVADGSITTGSGIAVLRVSARAFTDTPSCGTVASSARLASRNAWPFSQGKAATIEQTTILRSLVRPAACATLG